MTDFKDSQFFKTDSYIDGKWVKADNGAVIKVTSPATGRAGWRDSQISQCANQGGD